MIVSHKHKFIFIKVPKSAGTSIEAFFIPLLGDTDVNTSAQDGEEVYYSYRNIPNEWIKRMDIETPHRRIRGTGRFVTSWSERVLYKTQMNIFQNFIQYAQRVMKKPFVMPGRLNELEHLRASDIQEFFPKNLWDDYTSFGVIRNPWDRLVSLYYYLEKYTDDNVRALAAEGFEQFVHYVRLTAEEEWCTDNSALPQPDRPLMSDRSIWSRACRPAVQFFRDNSGNSIVTDIVRYEHLIEDMERVCGKLGIAWPGQLEPCLRGQTRKKKDYQDMYNEYTKEVVRVLYAADIEYMDYRF